VVYEQWKAAFRKYAVLVDFNERYELLDYIGGGGMGSIFHVKDNTSQEYYAAKTIAKSFFQKKDVRIVKCCF